MTTTPSTDSSRDQLRAFIARVEMIEEEIKTLRDDLKVVYAEAKAEGYDTKTMRRIVRLRKQDTNERQEEETLTQTYMHAMGMALDTPVHAVIASLTFDKLSRDSVVDTFKQLVPENGEIVVKMGGAPIRLWRDELGKAHAEEIVEIEEPKERKGKKLDKPATVLSIVPRGPTPAQIKEIADRAEAGTAARSPQDDGPKTPEETE